MANDSRSTSNVQLIASSQGGQMKLKTPRRRFPIHGIRVRRKCTVLSYV